MPQAAAFIPEVLGAVGTESAVAGGTAAAGSTAAAGGAAEGGGAAARFGKLALRQSAANKVAGSMGGGQESSGAGGHEHLNSVAGNFSSLQPRQFGG